MDNLLEKAKNIYAQRFGNESKVINHTCKGRVFCVEFGGNVIESCCSVDYFEDFCLILEDLSGAPHVVFSISRDPDRYIVKIAKLDFLDEVRSAMQKRGSTVQSRLKEFEEIGKSELSAFKELCFCILTANFSAEGGIRIQRWIDDGFITLTKEELYEELSKLGHRFPLSRANYIINARKFYGSLLSTINKFKSSKSAREWLRKNVKGIGYKESSHFLRNIGFKDIAIIDRHIMRYLEEKGLTERLKILTKSRYLELECILSAVADKLGITLAELDLYLWYIMTGRILK